MAGGSRRDKARKTSLAYAFLTHAHSRVVSGWLPSQSGSIELIRQLP